MQNVGIICISEEYLCLNCMIFSFLTNEWKKKIERVGILDETLCFGITREKGKNRVEKRNCFIRLQLAFFIWHLFHYLLFPAYSVMSSLFLLPKHFTEHVLHVCWQSGTI